MNHAAATARSRRTPRLGAALLACLLGAVALLSGCTSPNVVAYMNGAPAITIEELEQIEGPILEQMGPQGTREAVITILLLGKAAPLVAEANDVKLDPAQEQQITDATAEIEDAEARAVVEKYFRSELVKQSIGQQDPAKWASSLESLDITVNPRYGTWVEQQGTWVVRPGGSLSEPEADSNQAGQTGQQGG